MLLEEPEPPRGLWQPNERAEPNYAAGLLTLMPSSGTERLELRGSSVNAGRSSSLVLRKFSTLRERMADFQDQRYGAGVRKRLWQQLLREDEKLTAGEL